MSVQSILLDLGLNNAQIEDPERGITFQAEGPLDMRMDRSSENQTAADILNYSSEKEIEDILFHFGDERWARRIAQFIKDRRKTKKFETTQDLIECIEAAIPLGARKSSKIHPATRSFQALRIAVNKELEGLGDALKKIADLLGISGVFAVLSYHSGEDRIVKNAFRDLKGSQYELLFKKPLTPSAQEIEQNPKSRSAKLRAIRRIT